MNHIIPWLGAGLLLVVLPASGQADEPESNSRVSEALQVTTDAARLYEFEIASRPPQKLKFHPSSILRWSNPVAGEVYGNVFVWTNEGRPEVIGSIFQWYSPVTHGSHEFHSLAVTPLVGSREGRQVWTSSSPGIELRAIPDQSSVADSPQTRLRQARGFSRGFRIEKTDRAGVSRELRLLAQPLYRYGRDDSEVLDGSLFVFVQGTDPEVFLMIEARKNGHQWQWQYALARMNSVRFVARFQEQEVWRTEILPWAIVKNVQEPYTSFGPFELESSTR